MTANIICRALLAEKSVSQLDFGYHAGGRLAPSEPGDCGGDFSAASHGRLDRIGEILIVVANASEINQAVPGNEGEPGDHVVEDGKSC